jgi:small subunit ribosomal protein S16
MAVKLRLTRMGRRHRPFFRINAVDSRTPRDGRILEKIGHYDPLENDKDKQIVLNKERVEFWLAKGAVPSDTVSEILLRQGIKHKYAEEKKVRREKARTVAHKKGQLFTKTERLLAEKKKAQEQEAQKGSGEAAAGGAAQS